MHRVNRAYNKCQTAWSTQDDICHDTINLQICCIKVAGGAGHAEKGSVGRQVGGTWGRSTRGKHGKNGEGGAGLQGTGKRGWGSSGDKQVQCGKAGIWWGWRTRDV